MDKALAQTTYTLPDGRDVQEVTIAGHGLTAKILTLGAVLRDLRLDGHAPPLVLGYENVDSYAKNPGFLGAVVGRYANRIKDGQFELDGQLFQLDCNDNGNALHGGANGTWAQTWTIAEIGADFVALTLSLPDGHMGYPGQLDITCRYALLPDATLDIRLSARTDALTLCNLTPHGYFNLDGRADIADHILELRSGAYVPVNGSGIPLGHIERNDLAMDFRTAKAANSAELDVSFCFDAPSNGLQTNAILKSSTSGRQLEVRSNQPGLQVFNAAQMHAPDKGHSGAPYGPYCGVAFEPQIWPDAPNQPGFPNATLRPKDSYLNHSQFIFT